MQQIAKHIRKDTIRTIAIKGGHTAINLSTADILTALYFKILNHNPRQPTGDRLFITEKLTPVWQTTLAHAGYYAKKNLLENADLPKGTPFALSNAIGSAIAAKIDGKEHHTYSITTDSELDWQAIMLAGKQKLKLTLIIDRNNLSKEGFMDIEPLRQKIEAFNWNVIEVDGHRIEHIIEALQEAKNANKPTAIIAHTIPGKGTFMENDPEWYDKKPTKEEAEKAIEELK